MEIKNTIDNIVHYAGYTLNIRILDIGRVHYEVLNTFQLVIDSDIVGNSVTAKEIFYSIIDCERG